MGYFNEFPYLGSSDFSICDTKILNKINENDLKNFNTNQQNYLTAKDDLKNEAFNCAVILRKIKATNFVIRNFEVLSHQALNLQKHSKFMQRHHNCSMAKKIFRACLLLSCQQRARCEWL